MDIIVVVLTRHFQIARLAIERNEDFRDEFVFRIGTYDPRQLVFIDESALDCRTPHRASAYGPKGERVRMKGHSVRGARSVFHIWRSFISYIVLNLNLLLGTPCFLRCRLMELSIVKFTMDR